MDFGLKLFPFCSFTLPGVLPVQVCPHNRHVEIVPRRPLGIRVSSLSFPSRTVYCLVMHEAIPVHVPLRCTSRVGRCYTGEIDASTDRLSKTMIRARGPLPASHTNERWPKCCALPCSSRKSLPTWRIIVLISVCWNPGVQTPPPVVMDLAYIRLCKEHNIDETDLQSPMLVSQAVLITPLELSASISMRDYLVPSL
jgi:hypothetical protein